MSESATVVDFVERWQTGAFLLLASALAGFLAAAAVGEFARQSAGSLALLTFFAGGVAAFLALSYLIYGR